MKLHKNEEAGKVFQFHKGSIKTLAFVEDVTAIVFQFHKGSIKTPLGFIQSKSAIVFQFHKGSIKTKHGQLLSSHKHVSIPQRFD